MKSTTLGIHVSKEELRALLAFASTDPGLTSIHGVKFSSTATDGCHAWAADGHRGVHLREYSERGVGELDTFVPIEVLGRAVRLGGEQVITATHVGVIAYTAIVHPFASLAQIMASPLGECTGRVGVNASYLAEISLIVKASPFSCENSRGRWVKDENVAIQIGDPLDPIHFRRTSPYHGTWHAVIMPVRL